LERHIDITDVAVAPCAAVSSSVALSASMMLA
jgi:hypothetical protein